MANVLVFPGGTEIGLEIFQALRYVRDLHLFSAGSATSNHAPYVFERHYVISDVYSEAFLSQLNAVIREARIDYVFPAHDAVILALAENRDLIHASILTSPLETCRITRSKLATYRHFKDTVSVPHVFEDVDEIPGYPVFSKPDVGQGSQDALKIHSWDHAMLLLRESPKRLLLEYLPGEEVTVDCLSDRERGLLFVGPRRRTRIKSGIAMDSELVEDSALQDMARGLASKLAFYGAWFFQAKRDRTGKYKLLEVAPRIAGTMALNRVRGVNFPLLTILEHERKPFGLLLNQNKLILDRSLRARYKSDFEFQRVYVDFDDTLIVNGCVNCDLVKLLFQFVNQKKSLVLLTRHKGDIHDSLSRHRLSGLFDEIIHIDPGQSELRKSDYITDPKSIFIDDSFSERLDVSKRRGIPVFDNSMIEVLFDERR